MTQPTVERVVLLVVLATAPGCGGGSGEPGAAAGSFIRR
jgi:hypothetical protein